MSADFNPDQKEYKKIGKFKFFCIQNFPFIADDFDQMTYYELLCKLAEYIKKLIENNNSLIYNQEEVLKSFNLLQDYVNDYFDNLDVQEEINNKLDEMASNGTLTNLIKNYIDPIQQDFENSINQRINILESGSPLVASSVLEMTDTSRTYVNTTDGKWYYYNGSTWVIGGSYQSTGIDNNSITPEMQKVWQRNNLVPKFNWKTGKVYNVNTGNLMDFGGCYNEEFVDITGITKILSKHLYNSKLHIYFYNNNHEFISSTSINNNPIVNVPDNAKYVRYSIWPNEYTELPDNMTELYNMNNFSYQKPYSLKEFYASNGKNIKYTDSDLFITGHPYSFGSNDTINSYTDNTIDYNIFTDNTQYRGFYLYANFKVGDVIKIYGGAQAKYSIYPKAVNSHSIASVDKGDYKQIIINQDILDNLNGENLYKITSGYSSNTHENLTITINDTPITLAELFEKYTKIEEQKNISAIILGDSITALGTGDRGWLKYFNEIVPLNIIQNVAVNGATLMDKQNTIYDGNPVFNGPDNNENNVLGNQVQKILNNNYSTPDIIIIAIGTNAGIDISSIDDIYNTYYDTNNTLIPLSNLNRKTVAGAFRYCNETLKNKYPNAKIFWCSPIYAANIISKPISRVNNWADNLEKMCLCGGSQFINTMNCGITPVTENVGENGLYLIDGLHPNSNGAKYIGYYNARAIMPWLLEL